jgi:CRISPR-associated endonuclease/helicase Cas3
MKLTANKNAKKAQEIIMIDDCLAKSYKDGNGNVIAGRKIFNHCQIVGSIATELTKRLPKWVSDNLFPKGCELIVALHDLGKISPTFQKKIYSSLSEKSAILEILKNIDFSIESSWGGHAGISEKTLSDIINNKYIPKIVGQHHGYTPPSGFGTSTAEYFGGKEWNDLRVDFINSLKNYFNTDFPDIKTHLQSRVIAGLTTVSDWIGSGYYFDNNDQDWQSKIVTAVDNSGFVKPIIINNLSFEDIFGFLPNKTQSTLTDKVKHNSVHIVESDTGSGKTEAALYAAYKLLENNQATGVYFALPTQITSDKIYDRFNKFLNKILAKNSDHRISTLIHSNAWIKMLSLGEDCAPNGSWFDNTKKKILSPFAVGTIDQALMSVMNVKHGFVRTFGLLGKVIILDEIHSYDDYTNSIIDKLIEESQKLGCTIIILSATLTKHRKKELLNGCVKLSDYPLITISHNDKTIEETVVPGSKEVKTDIKIINCENIAINEIIKRAESGQQCIYIQNTVQEAQNLYLKIKNIISGLNIEIGLIHSRFVQNDRNNIENKWLRYYDKNFSYEERYLNGRILIGTQILEQSLDIDADFIISNIAPSDLLIQRIGRLWRHDRVRIKAASKDFYITSPRYEDSLKNLEFAFNKTGKIYPIYTLIRTLEVWKDKSSIVLPKDIRDLIEQTYEKRKESNKDINNLYILTKEKQENLAQYALNFTAINGQNIKDDEAKTRYGQITYKNLLLLKKIEYIDNNSVKVTLIDDDVIIVYTNSRRVKSNESLKTKLTLNKFIVKIPEYDMDYQQDIQDIRWLKDYFYLGSDLSRASELTVGILNKNETVTSTNNSPLHKVKKICYNSKTGLLIEK